MNIELPEDNTPMMAVSSVEFSGNILITTAQIIDGLPIIWSASGEPISDTPAENLYDFRVLSEALLEPGVPRQIRARTIQGFTSYILLLYQEHDYAGIYVYVPKSAMVGANQLKDDVLLIEVLEAPVTTVTVRSYDVDQNIKEKGYLRQDAIQEWSPVQAGGIANQKELNDFVNLLNQNPDRYVSATVTRGAQPKTLAVNYDVYEVNPWHWFIQVDNSGTRDRQWSPRVGVINTNLLGIDDTFMVIYQAPWDKDIDENYSVYGSYDFPIMGPKLRLNVYAGYSQFDVNPDAGPINFIGNGSFLGSILRYNVLQTEATTPLLGRGWFFDLKGMVEYTRSKVTPQLVPTGSSDVKFWMWGWGLELHRRNDMSQSSVSFDRWESFKGQSNGAAFRAARAGADSDFSIYDFRARHSQFLNPDKIHRVSGSFRWIQANERLVSAKMTSFGGMYTIRGYDEYEIVADGGILASFQYEYDLIAAENAGMTAEEKEQMAQQEKDPYEIKRVAPLVFVDYGRTNIRRAGTVVGEAKHEELMSLGVGTLLDIGNHFSGAVYYGYPLIPTPDTRSGKGRVNASFMLRW
jgi:hemolysin activation/secretion protein